LAWSWRFVLVSLPVIGGNEYLFRYKSMLATDALELVSYLIGSFAIGYGIGFLTISFRKALDQI
jgi:hypothetical protein